jgi:prevent-host-death family protein
MRVVGLKHAGNHLAKLIEEAVSGKPFLIAKEGKPIVKVEKFEESKAVKRLGFMDGEGNVPDYFNSLGLTEIEGLFYR